MGCCSVALGKWLCCAERHLMSVLGAISLPSIFIDVFLFLHNLSFDSTNRSPIAPKGGNATQHINKTNEATGISSGVLREFVYDSTTTTSHTAHIKLAQSTFPHCGRRCIKKSYKMAAAVAAIKLTRAYFFFNLKNNLASQPRLLPTKTLLNWMCLHIIFYARPRPADNRNRLVKCDEDLWGNFETRFALRATESECENLTNASVWDKCESIVRGWCGHRSRKHLPAVDRQIYETSPQNESRR